MTYIFGIMLFHCVARACLGDEMFSDSSVIHMHVPQKHSTCDTVL